MQNNIYIQEYSVKNVSVKLLDHVNYRFRCDVRVNIKIFLALTSMTFDLVYYTRDITISALTILNVCLEDDRL